MYYSTVHTRLIHICTRLCQVGRIPSPDADTSITSLMNLDLKVKTVTRISLKIYDTGSIRVILVAAVTSTSLS